LENCETSAIGRALANYNYSGNKRPSREEMGKVARQEPSIDDAKAKTLQLISTGKLPKDIAAMLIEDVSRAKTIADVRAIYARAQKRIKEGPDHDNPDVTSDNEPVIPEGTDEAFGEPKTEEIF
jgi:hypothetical protein